MLPVCLLVLDRQGSFGMAPAIKCCLHPVQNMCRTDYSLPAAGDAAATSLGFVDCMLAIISCQTSMEVLLHLISPEHIANATSTASEAYIMRFLRALSQKLEVR